MKKFYFSVINLGCSKNLVDLEFMVGNIFNLSDDVEIEFFTQPDDEEVEYIIINTCGFLSSSRDEAEETISYYDNLGKKIIVMGCYAEVKNDEFLMSLKNLHAVIPHSLSKNLDLIFNPPAFGIPLIKGELKGDLSLKNKLDTLKAEKIKEYLKSIGGDNINSKSFIWQSSDQRAYLNADYGFEYLKVSEGCDNNCTFCIIPNIRGRQKSRSIEDILVEVKNMINLGIKEIEIIAQDLTRYGTDLSEDKNPKLIELLEEIDKIEGDFKYRLFYMYPDILTLDNIKKLKNLKKMLPYFDIPFQHISPNILKRMGRFYNKEHIFNLLDEIKKEFSDVFIHTNFIVGFPGETPENVEELKDFIKKYRFDSISLFGYHDEVLATSYKLDQKVNDRIIEQRVIEVRKVIDEIYKEKQEKRKGTKETGYIMEILEKSLIIRPEIKAPEVDEYDVVSMKNILRGEIDIGQKVEYRV